VCVSFDFLESDTPQQFFLVLRLETEFADVPCAAIGAFVDTFHILLADARHVAETVHARATQRIVALQASLQFDPVEEWPVQRDARRFLVGEVGAQGERFETRALTQLALELLEVAIRKSDQLTKSVKRPPHVLDLLRHEFERVDGVVLRQDDPVAIENQPAWRRDGHRPNAVGLRQRLVVAVREGLQVNQAQREECHQHRNANRHDHETRAEDPRFAEVVLERNVQHLRLRQSWPAGARRAG